jgi:hypothetical protein
LTPSLRRAGRDQIHIVFSLPATFAKPVQLLRKIRRDGFEDTHDQAVHADHCEWSTSKYRRFESPE